MTICKKTLSIGVALATAALFVADPVHAQVAPAAGQGPALTAEGDRDGDTAAPETAPSAAAIEAMRQIASRLDETALQRDFRTDEEELAQLEAVRDKLAATMGELCCARRAMATRLQANLERVIGTASIQLDPTRATIGAAFGPSAPNRDELAILAKESQALVRNSASFPVRRRSSELISARHEDPRLKDPRGDVWSTAAPGNSWIEFSPGRQGMQMYGWRF
jgi:hypothetical protein